MRLSKTLHGDRVRLDDVIPDDLSIIQGWHQDPDFMRLFDARPPRAKSRAEMFRWLEKRHTSRCDVIFAIRPAAAEHSSRSPHLDNDTLIGYVELDGILWPHSVSGFGIAIGEPLNQGQGYGTEAARLALTFAFRELDLYRLTATIFSFNRRSIALFERLGFQREGVFREFLVQDGRRYDMFLYGLLRPEWRL